MAARTPMNRVLTPHPRVIQIAHHRPTQLVFDFLAQRGSRQTLKNALTFRRAIDALQIDGRNMGEIALSRWQ